MSQPEDRKRAPGRAREEITRKEAGLAHFRQFEGSRWQLFRAMLVFQAKLTVDGLKDLFLAPLAAVAVLLDMKRAKAGQEWESFERVMLLGERFERWLALYGVPGREPIDPDDPLDLQRGGILDEGGSDVLLDTIELTAKKLGRELRDRKTPDD
ncbi:MAG: hypothetical protein M8860_00585 [marine benthic group bacterium]|jgi:hypothetical protein|nr:hypothetical protein [Gemmatimonadota bacterium]MCL7961328.1 hypothetical protein [Candidatus Carthagonibacter metallireducens]MCL7966123.1 hypothetical protein [Gemmatimonadota bacterium]MCL7970430.1 hypothetical protein [Gemmatimonadota bacterium]MCL7973092.1 hypothetical protein [Gemmatimonadota bacterium]